MPPLQGSVGKVSSSGNLVFLSTKQTYLKPIACLVVAVGLPTIIRNPYSECWE